MAKDTLKVEWLKDKDVYGLEKDLMEIYITMMEVIYGNTQSNKIVN